MKKFYFILSLLLLICLSFFKVFAENTCTNATYTYTDFCGGGSCSYFHDAAYSDGSLPFYSKSGGVLTVIWPHSGTGVVNIWVDVITGEQVVIPINITITNCLTFSSALTLLCNGSTGTYSITDTNGSTSYTWTAPSGWLINNNSSPYSTSSTSVSIQAPSTGNGYNSITVSSNQSGAKTISVFIGPPAVDNSYTIYPTGNQGNDPVTLGLSAMYSFFAQSVPGATSYSWTLPAGFTGGHTGSSVHVTTASSSGTYTMYCQAANSCGSGYMHSLTINLESGGGGGPIERIAATESDDPNGHFLQQLDQMQFDTPYPSPASDRIQIRLSEPSVLKIFAFDGKTIHEQSGSGDISIPVGHISAGTYGFSIHGTTRIRVIKLMIVR